MGHGHHLHGHHLHGHHPHGHRHGHRHGERAGGGRRLLLSVGLNLLISLAQVVGGILSGSLALLSDAVHNLSDTASLGIAWGARRVARRGADARRTFGYRRAEVIGAFVNLVTLVLVALFLMWEAVERFLDPQPIRGGIMLAVAALGLAANLATALLLRRDAAHSLNVRSAFVHILADAFSSVGVVVGGLLVLQFGLYWVDPLLTLLIAAYILWHSYGLLRQTTDILMMTTPPDLDLGAVAAAVAEVEGVEGAHHLHVWQLDERHTALEAHVVVEAEDLAQIERIKAAVKARLREAFGIGHSTLEFEWSDPCADPAHGCYEADAALTEVAASQS